MIDKNERKGSAKLATNPANEYWDVRLCHDSEPVGPLVCMIHRNYIDLSDVEPLLEHAEVPLRAHPYEFIVAVAPNEDTEQYLFDHIRRHHGETFELSIFMTQCGDVFEMDQEMRHVIYDPYIACTTKESSDCPQRGSQRLENSDSMPWKTCTLMK
jgi:hypothetical protein